MNIAFPALLVFLLLLPGFVFRSRLKRIERTSLDYSPFGQIVTEGILWSIAAHSVCLFLTYLMLSRSLDATVLLSLLVSEPKGQATSISAVGKDFGWVASYFVAIILAAFLAPKFLRVMVTKYRLDRKSARFSSIFRFHQAPWYYLLTGADFESASEPDFIVVTAIVDVAGSAFLFSGILDEYFVDLDGQLDRVVLREVVRRPIAADKAEGAAGAVEGLVRFYPIDGDYFVLRYAEAITVNVEYVTLLEPDVPGNVIM